MGRLRRRSVEPFARDNFDAVRERLEDSGFRATEAS
jgi:hypothetical protein